MSFRNISNIEFSCLIILIGIFIITLYIFFLNINTPWSHFSDQTQSFLKGRLDVDPPSFDKHDFVIKDGKYYWPEGPFPSVLLVPFQLVLGASFQQGIMQFILIIVVGMITFKLARLKNFDLPSSLCLVAVFLMGSTLVGLIIDPKSWFFAQVVSVTLLCLLLLELETKRRWLIMGVLEGTLIATRPTSGLIIFALIFILLLEKTTIRKKIKHIFLFAVPIVITLIALMWFNYARFGNPIDNGYSNNDVGGFISPMRDLGLFSLQHIPTNFYYYFLASVQPITSNISVHLKFPYIKYDAWGLSLFLVAPFFLYSLKSLKSPFNYLILLQLTAAITLMMLLSYYATGWVQFGPRYTADFIPILYVLILYNLNPPKLTNFQKIFITLSCLFNIYLLATFTYLKV